MRGFPDLRGKQYLINSTLSDIQFASLRLQSYFRTFLPVTHLSTNNLIISYNSATCFYGISLLVVVFNFKYSKFSRFLNFGGNA